MSNRVEILPASVELVRLLRCRPEGLPKAEADRLSGAHGASLADTLADLARHEYGVVCDENELLRLQEIPDRLLPNEIHDQCAAAWMGRTIHLFEETDSTNDRAREEGRRGAPPGTVVIAEAQTRGRGRLRRSWVSPSRRNLYLSILLRPKVDSERWAQLALVAGLATCEAVNRWHPAAIKWPNDVLLGGRKIAGILSEMDGVGEEHFVVLGIGVNLNAGAEDFPEELRARAVSLSMATGAAVSRPAFTATLLERLEAHYDTWLRDGFAALAETWTRRSVVQNRRLRIDGPEGLICGRALGVDADGALRLNRDEGGEVRIWAGDVTVLDGYADGDAAS